MRAHQAIGARQRALKAVCNVGSGQASKRAAARRRFGVDDCTPREDACDSPEM